MAIGDNLRKQSQERSKDLQKEIGRIEKQIAGIVARQSNTQNLQQERSAALSHLKEDLRDALLADEKAKVLKIEQDIDTFEKDVRNGQEQLSILEKELQKLSAELNSARDAYKQAELDILKADLMNECEIYNKVAKQLAIAMRSLSKSVEAFEKIGGQPDRVAFVKDGAQEGLGLIFSGLKGIPKIYMRDSNDVNLRLDEYCNLHWSSKFWGPNALERVSDKDSSVYRFPYENEVK